MLNVPTIVRRVIRNEYTVKNHRIKFPDMVNEDGSKKADLTNNNIVYDSFTFGESVCSQEVFAFGLAEASSVQFETVDTEDYKVGDILDQRIVVSLEYKLTLEQATEVAEEENASVDTYERSDIGGYWYPIPIGVFYVEEAPRNHENMSHRRVVAYSRNERNFKIAFSGAHKKSKVSIPVDAMISSATIQFTEDDIVPQVFYGSEDEQNKYTRYAFRMETGYVNNQYGYQYLLWHSPVGSYLAHSNDSKYRFYPDDIVFIKPVYKKHDADSTIGPQMYSTCLSKMPANKAMYEGALSKEGLSGYKQAYTSSAQAVALYSCNFQPILQITAWMDDYACRCYPIFLQPNKTLVIDPANITLPSDVWKKTDVQSYTFSVVIPVKWLGRQDVGSIQWYRLNNKTGDSTDYADFANDWSFETTQTRDDYENIKTYYKKVSKSEYGGMKIAFESTFEFSKTSLGKYHTFSNAIGTDDILNSTAEINASFMKTDRNGVVKLAELNNENPFILDGTATVQNAWWDEYDVYPIGKIHYKYKNEDDEEVTANYTFNSESKSVYDMSDNWLLSNLSKPRTVSASLEADFGTDKGAIYKWTGDNISRPRPLGGKDDGIHIMSSLDDTTDGFWNVRKNCLYGYVKTIDAIYQPTPSSDPEPYTYDVWVYLGDGTITNDTYAKYLLKSRFIPKLEHASFTPLEMSVSNLPFLEAGDAITFIAKDGSIVNSYILKQTISGSQKIMSQIECVDGQILSREEDYEDE